MPSSYSTNLKIELQATGENSGTWGTITNTNLGTALEQAIVGYGNPSYASDANLTLTYTDTNAAQAARALVLNVTSAVSLTGTRELVVPTIQKQYIVQNNTTGSQSITVKTSAGTGITVPNGRKAHLYVDGTNVIYMDDYVDINGGAIDGTPIGASSASTGSFTTLTSSSTVTVNGGTANQVQYLNASKQQVGSANLTFDGTTLTANALTVTNNPTLSGGTANGVLYLNGSKVATSGSALTFDGTNLGVGGAASQKLHVQAAGTLLGLVQNTASSADARLRVQNTAGSADFGVDGTGTYFQDNSSRPMSWYVSGSEQMRLTSTGLGIGTSSPARKLDVTGTGRVTGEMLFGNDVQLTSDAYVYSSNGGGVRAGLFLDGTNQVIQFRTSATERMRIDSSGNVGIGTSSPSYKLDVNGAANFGANVYHRIGGTPFVATSGGFTYYYGNTNGIAWRNSADTTTQLALDSSGNLGLGVTPSAWGSGLKALQVSSATVLFAGGQGQPVLTFNGYVDSGGTFKYLTNNFASRYEQLSGQHQWYTAASGTAGNTITFTQAMTLNADGQFLVGATAAVSARGEIRLGGNASGSLFCMGRSGTNKLNIGVDSSDNVDIENTANTPIKIYTNSTERGRFTAGGYFKASNDGTYDASTGAYHEFNQSDPNTPSLLLRNKASSITGGVGGLQVVYSSASPNGTTATFLYCSDSSVLRASIRSNGGLANYQSNNVDLSDARTKKDIAPAASMWGKIGALEIVTYKYNDQTHDDVNVGVIAQQVESVEPVWVDADGFGETPEGEEPLKTVYTKDITFAAIKALQEAMARIEQLEAKVAVLESK